jgi:S-DNA-T family DNA segregation ATPase FtsK/SpoIIIE
MLFGLVVLAWMSLTSYDPSDWPSGSSYSPGSAKVNNRAGVVGAFLAWAVRYWIGSGIYIALVVLTIGAVLLVIGRQIRDVPWRFAGVVMLVTAFSSACFLRDSGIYRPVEEGTAGVLGSFTGDFLLKAFGRQGSWLIIAVTFCIGAVLTADTFLIALFRRLAKLRKYRDNFAENFAALRRKKMELAAAAAPVPAKAEAVRERIIPPGVDNIEKRTAIAAPPAPAAPPAAPPKPRPEKVVTKADKAKRKKILKSLMGDKAPDKPAVKPSKISKAEKKRLRKEAASKAGPAAGKAEFALPSADLLSDPQGGYSEIAEAQAAQRRVVLQQTLGDFNVNARVEGYMTGPVITLFEVSLEPGVKVAAISNLATDIARALAVPAVRVVPPRFGKDTVGIEVPNLEKELVRIKELMNLRPDAVDTMALPLYLGKDASGDAIVMDLAKCPHMLIAGTTGSGKSVCINTIVMSILLNRTPEDVRFILVDPKMVELAAFEHLPHLLCPMINDMRKAEGILEWAVVKMEHRYELLKEAGVKNLAEFNKLGKEEIYSRFGVEDEEEQAKTVTHLARHVIIIDELADMMMTSSKEVEEYIIRIAQKARAVGIHLVLSTQRPSANVVTGLIKSNMPCRISFRVASGQESRIVLDHKGAEVLLGQGDMLVLQPGTSNLIRAQGTLVDDMEIRSIVEKLQTTCDQSFDAELMDLQSGSASGGLSMERDELFDKAVDIVLESERGSVSLLQRRMQIGYGRASRIIDQMADAGIIGDHKGSQARECLITLEDWQAMKAAIAADQSGESSLNGEPTSS